MTSSLQDNNIGGGNVYQPLPSSDHTLEGDAQTNQFESIKKTVLNQKDTMENGKLAIGTLTFVVNGKTITYNASASGPQLPVPSPDMQDNAPTPAIPLPLNQDGQRVVNEFYDTELKKQVDDYIASQTGVMPGLTDQDVMDLKAAIQTGVVPDKLAKIFNDLSTIATNATQAQFDLPSTWVKGTQDPIALTPLTTGNIPSINTGMNLVDQIIKNVFQTYEDLAKAAQKVSESLGNNTEAATALTDFLKTVGQAIQKLKSQLRELQLADAQQTQKANQGKLSEVKDKQDRASEADEQRKEMRDKQEKMKGVSGAMKIVGPLVSALATVAGVLISVATLGIGTPAGIAIIAVGITLGATMTAYSIADSTVGVTSKVIDAFNDAMKELVPVPPNSEADQKAVKFAIVAAIALVLTAVIIASVVTGSGAGAAANVATQTTSQIIQMAIREGVQQLMMQLLLMVVMSTNALPELLGEIMKAHGQSGNAVQAVQIITMILEMAALMAMIAKGGSSSLSTLANQTGTAVGTGTQAATASATQAARSAVRKTVDEIVQEISDAIQATIAKIKELLKTLGNMIPPGVIENIETGLKGAGNFVQKHATVIVAVAKASPAAAEMVGGIIEGTMLLQVRGILIQQGQTQAAQQLLQELIGLLEKLVSNLQGAMTNREDAITQLSKDFTNLFSPSALNLGQATVI